jgi:preprotein translocase SecE subunit
VARTSRQQRRQRRAQAAGTPPLRPPARPVREETPEPQPSAEPRPERREEAPRSRIPLVSFVQEAMAELKKVEWPNQQAVVSGTAVVIVACIIVGAYLYLNDEVWKFVVQHLLIR